MNTPLPGSGASSPPPGENWGRWNALTVLGLVLLMALSRGGALKVHGPVALMGMVLVVSGTWALLSVRRHDRHLRAALALDEERLRRTIDDAPIGLALVGLDGRFHRVNATLCQIAGYSSEELLQKRFHDITIAEDLPGDVTLLERTLAGEIPGYTLEKHYRHRDGHPVPIELHVSLVRGMHDEPQHFISQVVDLTERRRSEAALRQSEREFATLARNADDQIIRYDAEDRYLYANPAALAIVRRDLADVVGRSHAELGIPPAVAAEWQERNAEVRARRETVEREVSVPRPEGQRIFASKATPEYDSSGRMTSILVVARDVTDARRAEAALRRQEARFAALVEDADDPIVRYDGQLRIAYMNNAMGRVIGRPAVSTVGQPVGAFTPDPLLKAQWMAKVGEVFNSGQSDSFDFSMHTADGSYRRFACRFTAELGSDGRPVGVFAIARDFTAQHLIETTLRHRDEELSALLKSAEDVISTFDRSCRHIFVNSSVKLATGFPPEHFIGRTLTEAGMPRPLVEQWEREITTVFESGKPASAEFAFPSPVGLLHVLSRLSPIRDADGNVESVLVISRNLTEKKRAELEREELLEKLTRSQAAVKTLKGLLPTCAWCHKIRDERGEWEQMESYISRKTDAEFSHGLCPSCAVTVLETP
ncbi:MAG: PAS domain S-box protein [Gemmatimonadota bacterium]